MNNKISTAMTALTLFTSTASASAARIIEFKSGHEGFDTKTFFYEGDQEVVAFDAQFTPALAEKAIAHLREVTDKPLTWLIITHPNPDKFNGAAVFQHAGAKVLASAATARAIPEVHAYKENYFVNVAHMFSPGQYPAPINVDETFSGAMDLVLKGGERISLRELSRPGVSSTQTVAFIGRANALVVGDLVHYGAHAWLEGGLVNGAPTPTLDGWKADLGELSAIYPANAAVYGGRGAITNLATAVSSQTAYLEAAKMLVDQEISAAGAALSYKELTSRFEARFPGYELAYLIEYGAYGLVEQELHR